MLVAYSFVDLTAADDSFVAFTADDDDDDSVDFTATTPSSVAFSAAADDDDSSVACLVEWLVEWLAGRFIRHVVLVRHNQFAGSSLGNHYAADAFLLVSQSIIQ